MLIGSGLDVTAVSNDSKTGCDHQLESRIVEGYVCSEKETIRGLLTCVLLDKMCLINE